jgi:hypothetical protein
VHVHKNVCLGSIIVGKLLDRLSNYQILGEVLDVSEIISYYYAETGTVLQACRPKRR